MSKQLTAACNLHFCGPKPYKFIGLGDIHGPKPYKFIRFGVCGTGARPLEIYGQAQNHVAVTLQGGQACARIDVKYPATASDGGYKSLRMAHALALCANIPQTLDCAFPLALYFMTWQTYTFPYTTLHHPLAHVSLCATFDYVRPLLQ